MATAPAVVEAVSGHLAASIPSPSQSVWYLGPLPVRAYALCILTGVVVAVWWADKRYRAVGGPRDVALDAALLGVPTGIVGARLYHVVSSPQDYFGADGDPIRILQIWHGGLGIWGGVPLGLAAATWLMRRRGLRFTPLADAVAPTILVAQAIGRVGNYFNQELFGGPTTLPWGLEIDDVHLPAGYASGTLFHPTFLYEALWNLAGAAFLVWLGRHLRKGGAPSGGRVMWAYLMVYTAGRVWIELLRIDEANLVAGLRLNVWTSILVFTAGLVGFLVTTRRGPVDAIRVRPQAEEQTGEGAQDPGTEAHEGTQDGATSGSAAPGAPRR